MKLISIDEAQGASAALLIGEPGTYRVRRITGGQPRSSGVAMREILTDWASWRNRLTELQRQPPNPSDVALDDVRLLAPVPEPRSLICVGLNYHDHAAETGAASPTEPVLFAKQVNCVVGPDSSIVLPSGSAEVDYEAELAVVIGAQVANVAPEDCLDRVVGYTAFNDVSARDWQARTSQWMAAKSFATFGPMGPALVTTDEIPDPQQLGIQLLLNGERLQDSHTSQMIFSVAEIISFISRVWTLQPGDVIATGTPAGVGFTRTPPIFLHDGDAVEVRVDQIGSLRSTVCRAADRERPVETWSGR